MKNIIASTIGIFVFIGLVQTSFSAITVHRISHGIQLELTDEHVQAQFYADNIIRITKWIPGATPDSQSLVVIQKTLPDIQLQILENDTTINLGSKTLHIIISKINGTIEFQSSDNKNIFKENGKAIIAPALVKNEQAYSIKQQFKLTPIEGIYGLGQHQYGYMNYRGHTVKLVQTNTDAVTPFFISTNNYGILWDNYSKTIFTDSATETSLWSDVASSIDYYFIYGSNMDSVIAGYRNLTGQAPMYGKWAYGYWQSKEHYASRDELIEYRS